MSTVTLPLTLLQEPSHRMLEAMLLQEPRLKGVASMVAMGIQLRLWISLGMAARTHNTPGLLDENSGRAFLMDMQRDLGLELYNAIGEINGGGAEGWMKLLERAGLCDASRPDGWWFASFNVGGLNRGTAGNFVRKEQLGGHAAGVARRAKHVARLSESLSLSLIGNGHYQDSDGSPITVGELNAAINLVKSLENSMGAPARGVTTNHWPTGLIAVAFDRVRALRELGSEDGDATLRKVCAHLSANRDTGRLPGVVEQVLENWDLVLRDAESMSVG